MDCAKLGELEHHVAVQIPACINFFVDRHVGRLSDCSAEA